MPQGQPQQQSSIQITDRGKPRKFGDYLDDWHSGPAKGAEGVGFVAVVPAVLQEHTDLNKLIGHYRKEALAGMKRKSSRAALVIGLNMEVAPDGAWDERLYESIVGEVVDNPASLPVAIVPFSWYWGGKIDNKTGKRAIPYGKIREHIVNHPEARRMEGLLRKRGMGKVYIHLGDDDVHSMLAGLVDRGDSNQKRPGLFSAAAEVLHGDSAPNVLSGGYRAPDTEPPLVKLAVDADQQTRHGLSRGSVKTGEGGNRRVVSSGEKIEPSDIVPVSPGEYEYVQNPYGEQVVEGAGTSLLGRGPYLPEPNTFARRNEDEDLKFGKASGETIEMVKKLDGRNKGNTKVVFDNRLAVATDMGRLGARYRDPEHAKVAAEELAKLRDIYFNNGYYEIGRTSGMDKSVVGLYGDPDAKEPIRKLRGMFDLVAQTHIHGRQTFGSSLNRISDDSGNPERLEAERDGRIASEAAIVSALTALLRQAIAQWRRGKNFDPLQ
jgi:hypothetical protein